MDSSNGGGEAPQVLSAEAAAVLREGISLVLSRWTALQMAVENQWGGRESRSKADQLASSILSWFTQTRHPLYIDELEEIIDESMVVSFSTEIEDGSVEEVAEQLMVMHEECLKGNYEWLHNLKHVTPQRNAVFQSKQVANDEDDESSDEEGSDSGTMAIEEVRQAGMDEDPSKTGTKPGPDPDGWTFVANRRNRGRRSG